MLVFPEEIAAVDDHAVPQMEQIHRDQRRLGVEAEDIGIVAGSGGHLLALVHLFDGGQQIAQRGGLFEAHVVGGFLNAVARSSLASALCLPSRNSRTCRTACA